MTVLQKMYGALDDMKVETDFVAAVEANFSRYKVLLVPSLDGACDAVPQQLSDYVKNGGQVVMAFKSGFTNEFSTVREVMPEWHFDL